MKTNRELSKGPNLKEAALCDAIIAIAKYEAGCYEGLSQNIAVIAAYIQAKNDLEEASIDAITINLAKLGHRRSIEFIKCGLIANYAFINNEVKKTTQRRRKA